MTLDLTKPMRWKSDHTPVIVLWSDDNDTFAEWQPPDDEPVRQHMRTEWFSERVENIPPEPPKPVGPEEAWVFVGKRGQVVCALLGDSPRSAKYVRYLRADLAMPKGEIERLRAERDALAKDAARYRWLRTAYFSGNSAYTLVGPTRTAEELDTRIDAAARIEREKGK